MKPIVAFYLPPKTIEKMFRDVDLLRLRNVAELLMPQSTGETVAYPILKNADALITGWGSPPISQEVLQSAPKLRLIAHSAGSIKNIVKPIVYDRGIRVTTAAGANAIPVAEFTVAMMVSLLKQVPWIGPAFAAGNDDEVEKRKLIVRELADLDVGLVAASRIGRWVIQLLRGYTNLTVKVYDPFLTDTQAVELGVIKTSLEEVCRCEVISIHAPNLPETNHLIDARMLSLMPDHAVLINTSRGQLVDESALVTELHRRPLYVALDVTHPEPPLPDSPLRSAPNLILTPHIAGAMQQARKEMGKLAINETLRFLSGEPLEHEVTRPMLATQA